MRFSPLVAAALLVTTLSGHQVAVAATELIDPAALGFGEPALTLDATFQGRLETDGGDDEGGLDLFEVRVIAPFGKWERGDWLFGTAINYSWRQADFGDWRGLGTVDLQTVEARLFASYSRPDSPWWLLGYVTPGIATDFESPSGDSFTASALALLGYRWNARLDFAVGAFASYELGEATGLGAVGVIWRPSDEWIMQVTPPIVAIGWRPTRDWTIGAVAYPAGGGWEVGDEGEEVRQVKLSLWRAALSVERKLGAHWRVSVRGGIAFGGELELRDRESRVVADTDLQPAPFGAVSVKWGF